MCLDKLLNTGSPLIILHKIYKRGMRVLPKYYKNDKPVHIFAQKSKEGFKLYIEKLL